MPHRLRGLLVEQLGGRANSSFRWSRSSVIVPTVEREVRTGFDCSMAIAGGTPSTQSTAGRCGCPGQCS
jgi:hypothetical protein